MKINNVDFDEVGKAAMEAAKAVAKSNWPKLADIVDNISRGIANDVLFLERKKTSGEFDESDARIFIEDQKIVSRMRLRSVAIITMQIAEDILNAIIGVFQIAIKKALNWSIL